MVDVQAMCDEASGAQTPPWIPITAGALFLLYGFATVRVGYLALQHQGRVAGEGERVLVATRPC